MENGRKSKNLIDSLEMIGVKVKAEKEIEEVILTFFLKPLLFRGGVQTLCGRVGLELYCGE